MVGTTSSGLSYQLGDIYASYGATGMLLHTLYKYIESCLIRTLSKPKTCLNQEDCTVPSTKCLCNLNLCKPNTCLNWTTYAVPKGFGLDRFYCIHNMGNWNHPFCREVSLWTDHHCLNPSLFLLPVLSQLIERSCICVLRVSISPLFLWICN